MSQLFEPTVRSNVLRVRSDELKWLSTGANGGSWHSTAAYNITVPKGWNETDLEAYAEKRRADSGFDQPGPTLLTGVEQRHAHWARLDSVEVIITAGISNPTTLPPADSNTTKPPETENRSQPGTINIITGTSRSLSAGALANLIAVVTEAKTATLTRLCGFSGTTSDAVVVGSDPTGRPTQFSGSATPVGRAVRACVREALTAALESRYETEPVPESIADATYGCATTVEATVSRVE